MNALAMPSSSRIAEARRCACFCGKSLRMREERAATSCSTRAISPCSFSAGGCISHDAIGAERAARSAGIVQVMQMGYRLAHGEEGLVRVERPPEQHAEQLARAARAAAQRL